MVIYNIQSNKKSNNASTTDKINTMNASAPNGVGDTTDDAAQLANPEVDGECQQS